MFSILNLSSLISNAVVTMVTHPLSFLVFWKARRFRKRDVTETEKRKTFTVYLTIYIICIFSSDLQWKIYIYINKTFRLIYI